MKKAKREALELSFVLSPVFINERVQIQGAGCHFLLGVALENLKKGFVEI